jgi:hypothetical protein
VYQALEKQIKNAIKQHHMNHSVVSVGLNALLLYPDHPWSIGGLYGYDYDPETQRQERFLIAQPEDLDQEFVYAKERRLIEIVKAELQTGRRCCHVYAVYTRKRDVTRRLERILTREGFRVAVLTSDVPPEEARRLDCTEGTRGVQVTISLPKIIETGIDLLHHASLIFFETGYSLRTLRQASRRSWRIGQCQPVRVFYLHYEETMQSSCLRLMGKKLLVSLAMEGKFSGEGLQSLDEDDDMLTAMARELVTAIGVGESAAAVWRQIQSENNSILNFADSPPPESTLGVDDESITTSLVRPTLTVEAAVEALKFGTRPPSMRPLPRRREAPPADAQFPLF